MRGKSHMNLPGIEDETPPTNRLSHLNPGVFIKIRFLLPSKHTASPLQTPGAYNGGLLWESHDRAREGMEQWRTGNCRGAQTAWKRKLLLRDTAVGIVCVCVCVCVCPRNKWYIHFLML